MKKIKLLTLISIATLTGAIAPIVSCACNPENPEPETKYNVVLESNNHLELTDVQNEIGKDYIGKITQAASAVDKYDVPQTDCYYDVTVGNAEINDFMIEQVGDYDDYYVKFTIPASDLTNAKNITITAKDCPHYLCFESISEVNGLYYNFDGDPDTIDISYCYDLETKNWEEWDTETTTSPTIFLNPGDKLYIKNNSNSLGTYNSSFRFVSEDDTKISVTGNVMSMINFSSLKEYCFSWMFSLFNALFDTTPILPATNLASYCYDNMFTGCVNLTVAPYLPAETLADFCYQYMFSSCENLYLSEEQTKKPHLIFTCPELEGLTDPVNCMFEGAGEQMIDTPEAGKSYCWVEPS